jgi:cytochrome c oxidase subunit 4
MNDRTQPSTRNLWIRNGIVWIALVALLTLTLVLAYAPLGPFNGPVSLLIAALKAALVLTVYMELKDGRPLLRLIAFVPVAFVCVLFSLTLADVLTRF